MTPCPRDGCRGALYHDPERGRVCVACARCPDAVAAEPMRVNPATGRRAGGAVSKGEQPARERGAS